MEHCLFCDQELSTGSTRRGRKAQFCPGSRCRVAHFRREKRYKEMQAVCNVIPDLSGLLVLELFPGAGLFGRSFEALGATVVRGPDILWGGDVRDFHGVSGRFDGVIGGPPCQIFSRAAIKGTNAINLIPEFERIVSECNPTWAVMENVREARAAAPDWDYVFLRDFDCGGLTHRRRGFWFYGLEAPPSPAKRDGNIEYSVLASNWNRRGSNRIHGHLHLSAADAGRLQGFPELPEKIINGQPGWKKSSGEWDGVSARSREVLATHMCGNGVPKAMGGYIAQYVAYARQTKYRNTDLHSKE